ncbi:MAG: DUF3137 domain-containing protein [Bacteroidota bacterium]
MRRLEEFRIYYNHTIHPELVRMELGRKRLIRLLFLSLTLIFAVILIELYIDIIIITLIGVIPIFLYISWLLYQIRKFRLTFKPNVVNLLMDFMDDRLNYGELKYDPKKFIPKEHFLNSQIFGRSAEYYLGEDQITGSVGNLEFELCEIRVQDKSKVDGRLKEVFKGLFLHTQLEEEIQGKLLILPRWRLQFLDRSIQQILKEGGKNISDHLIDAPYQDLFNTYAYDPTKQLIGTPPQSFSQYLIPAAFQKKLSDYHKNYVESKIVEQERKESKKQSQKGAALEVEEEIVKKLKVEEVKVSDLAGEEIALNLSKQKQLPIRTDEEIVKKVIIEDVVVKRVKAKEQSEQEKERASYSAERRKCELYISFVNKDIYIFLTELDDFLEPHLFYSNASFEMIRDFYKDIDLVIQIIEEFDRIH